MLKMNCSNVIFGVDLSISVWWAENISLFLATKFEFRNEEEDPGCTEGWRVNDEVDACIEISFFIGRLN